MNTILDAGTFGAAALGIIILLALVGYFPTRLFAGSATALVALTAIPVGVVMVVAVGGAIVVYFDGPLGVLVPTVFAVLCGAGLAMLLRDIVRKQSPFRPLPEFLTGTAVLLVAIVAAAWQVHAVFGYGPLATVSWNNDVLSYAYMARHIAEFGTSQPGWIQGFNAGPAARSDVPGAFVLLSGLAPIFGDTMRVTLPLMAALTAVVAICGYLLVRGIAGSGRIAAAFIGVTCVVSFPATYDAYQYFLSERLAIVITFASAIAVMQTRHWGYLVGIQVVVTVALIATYPHVIPLQIPIAVTIAAVCVGRRLHFRLRTALIRGVATVAGTGLGAVVIVEYLGERIDFARILLSASAGWSMPTFSFLEALGMRDPFEGNSRPELALGEILVILALLPILTIVIRRGGRPRVVAAASLLLPSLLFVRFAFAEPGSYRQWKAMAFAAPFAVVAIGVALCLLAGTARLWHSYYQGARVSLVVVVAIWMVVAFSGRYDPTGDIKQCHWTDCPVGSAVRDRFEHYERNAGSGPVAVARGPYWPSMTAAYFLWGRSIAMRDLNNWAVSGDPVTRTLGPNGWEINAG
jgi:hypothetical protein